ncbi:hypothetical protein T05_4202 [Trichinella murrelli]|uniref:Uncharacterized protein n=1 Tax=Trichinella murrelli TaxID=144512 RepID=A0A0V0RYD8_9BILA|nr:hypothetical protein T05_4202 [Trichinella murrelli]
MRLCSKSDFSTKLNDKLCTVAWGGRPPDSARA